MSQAATRRRSCKLTLSLLAGMSLLLLALVTLPWLARSRFYDDAIERRTQSLERYLAILQSLPALERRLEEVRANRELDAYYLPASDAAQGGIALQRRVEEIVSGTEGNLTSIQILPEQAQEDVLRIGVRLRFSGSVDSLQRLLFGIETAEPLLFITDMDIRQVRRGRRNVRGRKPTFDVDLNVNLDIYGYIRKDAV
jgi:general secretion pathway protein M